MILQLYCVSTVPPLVRGGLVLPGEVLVPLTLVYEAVVPHRQVYAHVFLEEGSHHSSKIGQILSCEDTTPGT